MKNTKNILLNIFLFIIVLSVLVPIIWALSNSFRTNSEIGRFTDLSIHTFMPKDFVLDNFINIFKKIDMLRIIFNTVFVASAVTFISIFFNAITAYALANIEFKGKNAVFLSIILLLILPIEVLIIPLFIIMSKLGFIDSYISLILPFVVTPFGIFFMRQFFLGIPKALSEAAVLDGCGHFKIFTRIYLPLSSTPLFILGLLTFLSQWDSFLIPATFINSPEKKMLQVALGTLSEGLYARDYGILFAGIVISIAPIMILFFILQKKITENVSNIGIK